MSKKRSNHLAQPRPPNRERVAGILGGTTLMTIALAFLGHKKPKEQAH